MTIHTDPTNTWIRVGTLLNGVSSAPLRDAHVVYNSAKIEFVGTNNSQPPKNLLKPDQTKPDTDLPDHTLMPGLIEAHAHFFLNGGELDIAKRAAYLKQSPSELLQAALPRLQHVAGFGIAAVRDAGDKDGVGLALGTLCREVRMAGDNPGVGFALAKLFQTEVRPFIPFVDSPGAAIFRKGRYGSFMGEPLENQASLRESVLARINAGAERIKLIATGVINFKEGRMTTAPQLSAAEIHELVTAAKSFGKQTFAHASGDDGIENVIEGGVDTVEHGFFIRDDQLARMRDRQIGWVPTFAPVQKQIEHASIMGWDATTIGHLRRILDQHAASLVKAHEMGVIIIAGSDAGSYGVGHGIGLLEELEFMERAGMPSIAVLNAATGVSARRLAFGEKVGEIAVGAKSRFILTATSPLKSVSVLKSKPTVIFDGRPLR